MAIDFKGTEVTDVYFNRQKIKRVYFTECVAKKVFDNSLHAIYDTGDELTKPFSLRYLSIMGSTHRFHNGDKIYLKLNGPYAHLIHNARVQINDKGHSRSTSIEEAFTKVQDNCYEYTFGDIEVSTDDSYIVVLMDRYTDNYDGEIRIHSPSTVACLSTNDIMALTETKQYDEREEVLVFGEEGKIVDAYGPSGFLLNKVTRLIAKDENNTAVGIAMYGTSILCSKHELIFAGGVGRPYNLTDNYSTLINNVRGVAYDIENGIVQTYIGDMFYSYFNNNGSINGTIHGVSKHDATEGAYYIYGGSNPGSKMAEVIAYPPAEQAYQSGSVGPRHMIVNALTRSIIFNANYSGQYTAPANADYTMHGLMMKVESFPPGTDLSYSDFNTFDIKGINDYTFYESNGVPYAVIATCGGWDNNGKYNVNREDGQYYYKDTWMNNTLGGCNIRNIALVNLVNGTSTYICQSTMTKGQQISTNPNNYYYTESLIRSAYVYRLPYNDGNCIMCVYSLNELSSIWRVYSSEPMFRVSVQSSTIKYGIMFITLDGTIISSKVLTYPLGSYDQAYYNFPVNEYKHVDMDGFVSTYGYSIWEYFPAVKAKLESQNDAMTIRLSVLGSTQYSSSIPDRILDSIVPLRKISSETPNGWNSFLDEVMTPIYTYLNGYDTSQYYVSRHVEVIPFHECIGIFVYSLIGEVWSASQYSKKDIGDGTSYTALILFDKDLHIAGFYGTKCFLPNGKDLSSAVTTEYSENYGTIYKSIHDLWDPNTWYQMYNQQVYLPWGENYVEPVRITLPQGDFYMGMPVVQTAAKRYWDTSATMPTKWRWYNYDGLIDGGGVLETANIFALGEG